ncbi:MAG: MBL fold metallo-hydrolase [Proteobacteria bacterium]|nr:MAG: MBL fold metallo-hydrolase [Pseudomonadota bacterium]
MKAAIIPVTPFQQNCSLIWCDKTGRGAVIDPGGDLDRILGEIDARGVVVEKILLTHGHADHAAGTVSLKSHLSVPVEGPHRDETYWLERLPESAEKWGFEPADSFEPDRWLENGDQVIVGSLVLDVYHCPGHTPGHIVFFESRTRIAFVGDVLFKGSIGRTDFPRGNHEELLRSIRERLWPLGDDVTFVPGHGPVSTFGDERQTNPYVGDNV